MVKQKTPKGSTPAATPSDIADSRFSNFNSDPRFRLPSKKQTRTTVDKRFSRMLKDEDFSNTAKVEYVILKDYGLAELDWLLTVVVVDMDGNSAMMGKRSC